MANTEQKFGLRPVRLLDGSPFINAQNRYRIASNYGTAIFQGDMVIQCKLERDTLHDMLQIRLMLSLAFLMVVSILILQRKNRRLKTIIHDQL